MVFFPNIDGVINVLKRKWAVLDLMALNSPSEILLGWVDKCFVQLSCDLSVLDLPLCEMFHVFGDRVDKSECFVLRIKVMQSGFIHIELHVLFVLCFTVENEHFLVTPIYDKVSLSKIILGNKIGYGIPTEPHMPVVAWNICLI